MNEEWITYLKILRGRFVQMGGPGSGHHRHKGRKGKRGGSLPSKGVTPVGVSKKEAIAATKPLVDMMGLHQRHAELKQELNWVRGDARRVEKDYWKKKTEYNKKRLDKARQRRREFETKVEESREELKAHSKTKAPGFGEWERDVESSKEASTSWRRVNIYKHPDYGTVRRELHTGARRQRIPNTAEIKYISPTGETFKKEWSGTRSYDQAKRFLDKHWGTKEQL